jgi:hypothetical protein
MDWDAEEGEADEKGMKSKKVDHGKPNNVEGRNTDVDIITTTDSDESKDEAQQDRNKKEKYNNSTRSTPKRGTAPGKRLWTRTMRRKVT